MCQWILKANGKVVPRRTCRPLNVAEQHSETEKKKQRIFDTLIEGKWGNTINPSKKSVSNSKRRTRSSANDDFIEYEDDDEDPRLIPDIDEAVDAHGKAINVNPPYDKII